MSTLQQKGAGVPSKHLNSPKNLETSLMINSKRSYREKDQHNYYLEKKQIEIKDYGYYRVRDSLWNETSRLSPSIAKYSHENVDPNSTFKKTVCDLQKIEIIEREE